MHWPKENVIVHVKKQVPKVNNFVEKIHLRKVIKCYLKSSLIKEMEV